MFLVFRDEVEDAVTRALTTLEYPVTDLGIEEPPEDVNAIIASSVAFRLASDANEQPSSIADAIAAEINLDEYEYVDQVEVKGPYLNFTPNTTYYHQTLQVALDESYGHRPPKNESIIVEHTSANPTGPIHVGRARNPILGDAIARLLDYAGFDIETQYYVNDAGRQIAVFTWAYETFSEDELPAAPERDRIEYDLVRYYRYGNKYLENADSDDVDAAEAEIQSILKGLDAGDPDTYERVRTVIDQVLEGMQECLARLPAEFDEFVRESRFIQNGATQDIVERLQSLDKADIKDGAWQLELPGFEKSLVFLRSDNTSLYTTRDIAYHEYKLATADRVVTILGEDHKLQSEQLKATLQLLGVDIDPLQTVFYSWVNLPDGGMSTRAGTGINLDDLLDEAIERARNEVEKRLDTRTRADELTSDDIDRIAKQVGIGAVRYDIVSKQPSKGITFKWEEALDFEAQSAPYVQYAHARACGILAEAENRGIIPISTSGTGTTVPPPDSQIVTDLPSAVLGSDQERALLREIARFPAVIDEAATALRPHMIATYTRDLADRFNSFYRDRQVLTADSAETRHARLLLVRAARHSLANSLEIVGVEAPESM